MWSAWYENAYSKLYECLFTFFVCILMYNKPNVAISGISEELYEQLARQEEDIAFYCEECGFALWDQYQRDELTASQLLRTCGQLNGPSPDA